MSKNFVEIARIGSTYGLGGELRLYPFANDIEAILSYGKWYLNFQNDMSWDELQGEHVFRRGNKIYIKLAGIDDINDAKKFTNALIGVPREALPKLKEDETYWTDLIGMKVYNKSKDSFGSVIDIMETGYNDVLICKKSEDEYLIPYINNYILDVDLENKKIIVDWEYDY
ncbi:ribosome maturation factor RimM [Pseudofrancisella aestuarii]|uniref:Ribosome maturation factor RimM n=1 Tax=Pseudofrancisella aestuarii TaxID=2670347 RepID=A0ABV9TCZ1_9GAMM|nr:ribosome maturation factor RimM [Pseudofrancisella aestuarii]